MKRGKSKQLPSKKRHLLEKSKDTGEHREQGNPADAQHVKQGGDPFAYGIAKALDQAKSKKGSKQGFLGVESETLNPLDYVEKEKLNVKKG